MGIFDKVTKLTSKAIESVNSTKDKITDIYKQEGIEGFLDRADKGLDTLEKKANIVVDKTTEYVKDIHDNNKKEVKKATNNAQDDLDKVVKTTVAYTVGTVSAISKDLAEKTKGFIEKNGSIPEKGKSQFDLEKFADADNVSLVTVMKFVGAKEQEKDVYRDSHGNHIRLKNKAWHDGNKGGVGAVSLLKHQLHLEYNKAKKIEDSVLEKEAISILDKISINEKVEKNKEKEVPEVKKPAVKRTRKPKVEAPIEKVEKAIKKRTPAKKIAKP